MDLGSFPFESVPGRRVVGQGHAYVRVHSTKADRRDLAASSPVRTKAFISGSPKHDAIAGGNPPPKPFVPAIPTVPPGVSTVVLVPSSTLIPIWVRISVTVSAWSDW